MEEDNEYIISAAVNDLIYKHLEFRNELTRLIKKYKFDETTDVPANILANHVYHHIHSIAEMNIDRKNYERRIPPTGGN